MAVLPASPFVDEAVRARGAWHAVLRAIRLELAHRRGGPAPRDPAGSHGWHVVLPRALRDGAEPRDLRDRSGARDPSRLPLDRHASRRGRLRARDFRWRVPLPRAGLRDRHGRAMEARPPGDGPRSPLRRLPTGRQLCRQARLHHRQGGLGVRARQWLPPLGEADRARLAAAGRTVRGHEVPRRRPRALRPAVRGQRPRWRRRDRERVHRRRRPDPEWLPRPHVAQ